LPVKAGFEVYTRKLHIAGIELHIPSKDTNAWLWGLEHALPCPTKKPLMAPQKIPMFLSASQISGKR
jgi:hypothetical protein